MEVLVANDSVATLFNNGGSQAVRLPKEYRFEGSAVRIRKHGSGVLLEPLEKPGWPAGYWERLKALAAELPDDFARPEALPASSERLPF
ncbi:antitoxin [Longimicrobium sp.]|jgi:antitoxin VapB|uniref:antitoxin n=1 Tax=Longimicrobium sp. TaxID=2029185 RepID=UPI0039C8C0E6